ncbi:MAG: hypothetical protein Q7S32_01020 [bacterium]|nr:hypothetical protein [bacterium]
MATETRSSESESRLANWARLTDRTRERLAADGPGRKEAVLWMRELQPFDLLRITVEGCLIYLVEIKDVTDPFNFRGWVVQTTHASTTAIVLGECRLDVAVMIGEPFTFMIRPGHYIPAVNVVFIEILERRD